jgi:ABC-type lipoprotein release transport system permease subunit
VVAWYLADMASGLLYGVEAQDLVTFAAVPALLLAVALIPCWLPAVRATHERPATALRHE